MRNSSTGSLGRFEVQYDKLVKNSTAETVPPYGVMQVIGAAAHDEEEEYAIAKPTGSSNAKFLINGPLSIGPGDWGHGTSRYPAVIAYDPGTPPLSPTPGSLWGPFGDWKISINGTGFLITGTAKDGLVRAAEAPPLATAGADFPLIIVRNDSGLNRQNRSIFGLSVPLNVPPAQLPVQPIWASNSPDSGVPWVVSLNDVNAGGYVDCAPVGILAVRLNYRGQEYENPAQIHRFADASEGDYDTLVSCQDGPARILWRERGGISGSGTNGIQWAFIALDQQGVIDGPRGIVTVAVTAATGFRGQAITPGKGMVQLYEAPFGPAGTPWQPGPIVEVESWAPEGSAVGKGVPLRPSRRLPNGNTLYELVNEPCKVFPAPTP